MLDLRNVVAKCKSSTDIEILSPPTPKADAWQVLELQERPSHMAIEGVVMVGFKKSRLIAPDRCQLLPPVVEGPRTRRAPQSLLLLAKSTSGLAALSPFCSVSACGSYFSPKTYLEGPASALEDEPGIIEA